MKIRCRYFADGPTQRLQAADGKKLSQPALGRTLSAGQGAVLGIEILNTCPHRLSLHQLAAVLPGTEALTPLTVATGGLCLASGAKYSALFRFLPGAVGAAPPGSFAVHWTRHVTGPAHGPPQPRAYEQATPRVTRTRARTTCRSPTGASPEGSRGLPPAPPVVEGRPSVVVAVEGVEGLDAAATAAALQSPEAGEDRDEAAAPPTAGLELDDASSQHYFATHVLPPTCYEDSLPNYHVQAAPIRVTLAHVARCRLGGHFVLTATVHNQTNTCQLIALNVLEPSSALFSVAGLKQSTFTVLPSAKHSIRLRLVPLQCGQLQLPRLQLRQLPAGLLLFEPSDAGAVFVYPSEKAR